LEVIAGEDQVSSYFGMRKFSIEDDRLCLNDAPLFQLRPLDQGYLPDGLYTPPTGEAMRHDIDLVKSLGFNLVRKHFKVEPRRYYYYCDRVGLIVWQVIPNGGKAVDKVTSSFVILLGSRHRDKDYCYACRIEEVSRVDFRREMQKLVDH
jgi:beta-galactosidase/beta-glucuronidase